MIKIGEKEGNLYETMEILNDYLKIMRDCSFSLKNSLEYYVILFIYLLGICKFLGTYIMPTFVCLFEGMDIDPGVFPYIIKHGISRIEYRCWANELQCIRIS